MDFNLINLLWSVLAVPIGWFALSYTKRGDKISKLESRVQTLENQIGPLSNDLKIVTRTLTDVRISIEQRLYAIATDNLNKDK